jgi:lysyl-tRNA synthetase class 2
MITSTALTSQSLLAAVYDSAQEKLQLDFCDGSSYVYYEVAPALFRSLLDAPSKGRFFNQPIRGHLPFVKHCPECK